MTYVEFEREKHERLAAKMAKSLKRMEERIAKWKVEHPGEAYPFYGGPKCRLPGEKHTRQGHWT